MAETRFDASDPVLAAVSWSRIAESDDGAAHLLLQTVGPVAALTWLLQGARGRPPGASAAGADDPAWQRAAGRWLPRLHGLDPRRELEVIRRRGGRVLLPGEPGWPPSLDDLPDPPWCLWLVGAETPADLTRRAVAIVGARACTDYGAQVCRNIAFELAERGITVVSGGAFGIDAAAHHAALAASGQALAVMAGGLDRFYPAANAGLIEQVARTGAVIAEVPPGSSPMRSRFLRRNRLIAAMGAVTVVVEAGWRSGALNTAGTAAELMRPVAAVPGPVTSAASAGTHRLIRSGAAVLVTDADQITELLEPLGSVTPDEPAVQPHLLDDLDSEHARVLDAMPARGSAGFDALVRAAGLAPQTVQVALGVLEMTGRAQRVGSTWTRVRTP